MAIGCFGEWYLFKKPMPADADHHRSRELQFILVVAIGVTMELCGLAHSIPEAIRLEREVIEGKIRVEELRKANLTLESSVVFLKARNLPRFIEFDEGAFRNALRGQAKVNVELLYLKDDLESYDLARKIMDGLCLEQWPVIGLRPIREEDASPDGDKYSVPLSLRAGLPSWGGIAYVSKTVDLSTNNPINKLIDALNAAQLKGSVRANLFRTGHNDPRLPDNFVRLIVGSKYVGPN